MANPMRLRVQRSADAVELKILMSHPMDTGRVRDPAGALVPAWFIRQVEVFQGDTRVLCADWGPAVSRNPFLQVSLRAAEPGQVLRVRWHDNHGDSREDSVTVS